MFVFVYGTPLITISCPLSNNVVVLLLKVKGKHVSYSPNPFNPETTIQYELPEVDVVRLSVYALTGQLVRILVDAERTAGTYSVIWDGRDGAGRDVASGVYLCRMEVDDYLAVRKLLLVK